MKSINWPKVVNSLNVAFPEVGDEAPEIEMLPQEIAASDVIGNLTRITLDIFVFDNEDLESAFMMQNEKMRIYQNISLQDSLDLVARGKNKKS